MARDYRRDSPTRAVPRARQGRFSLWSFLLGAMFGAFGVGYYWTQNPDALLSTPAPLPGKVERPAPAPPNFEFPNILRDTEVNIGTAPAPPSPTARPVVPADAQQTAQQGQPETARAQPTQAPKPTPPTAATAGARSYLVQVGSFKRGADAERLKAELALLGITSRVEVATIASGETFHRVRTGPFADQSEVERVRALLKRNGKDSMTIPIR